uniref:Trafficking protein particle complex subunit n=1 Tax=Chlamydomonas euryale TaxID=1486919 RepID=A0A7R9UZR6_9CHLO|mmetsp:Transcript_11319/g.33611  ORF Transcript_11319/g.33611 Transcript_11319/m.33611 type:complete len:137 (+) Transcript_11319:126-536(+)
MSSSVLTLVIAGPTDQPLYEIDLTGPKEQQAQYLHQFVLHASLDAVDEALITSKECHLKVVDRFNNLMVTAFVTPGNARFLLLHDGRNDESIKAFFFELYELYVKIMINPFHGPATKISNREFDKRVKLLARRLLG